MERVSTFEHGGYQFAVELGDDPGMRPPWMEHDGHGDIREEWCRYGRMELKKKPGEIVLHSDGDYYWIYDRAGAQQKALAEGWGISPEEHALLVRRKGRPPSRGEIAEAAVTNDINYCRQWLTGDRWWATARVVLLDAEGDETEADTYLGGIDYSYDDASEKYVTGELASDLAAGILAEWEDCIENDVLTNAERARTTVYRLKGE